jgi:putative transposase
VTFVQRFGGALNLNVHFHGVISDGVRDQGAVRFMAVPAPTDEDVEQVLRRIERRVRGLLKPRLEAARDDARPRDALAASQAESVTTEPRELLRRMATLVPPPRARLVRYHGVFGPASSRRADVIPKVPEPAQPAVCADSLQQQPRRTTLRPRLHGARPTRASRGVTCSCASSARTSSLAPVAAAGRSSP